MRLLDTNIVSFIHKKDTRAQLYLPHLINQELAISMMTVAELYQWAKMRRWGERRVHQLEIQLQNMTLLPIDLSCCRHWADVRSARFRSGNPISPQDAWVAATALRYQLPLITHNPNDYSQIAGLQVITEI